MISNPNLTLKKLIKIRPRKKMINATYNGDFPLKLFSLESYFC